MAIITISRGTFSGGKELAECIAEKLDYRCISREMLLSAAEKYNIPMDKLTHALADKPGILERMGLERVHYLAYIREALINEIKDDRVVYHGYAGHLLLRGVPHVLRVRVIANMEYRIKAAMERNNLNHQDAIDYIKERDDERAKWTRVLYHVDLLNSSLYDMVINLDHVSLDSACEAVCLAATSEALWATPESQKIMDDLILSTQVRAKIAAEGESRDGDIGVDAEGGIVTISGIVHSIEDADEIKRILHSIPKIKDVRFDMKIRTYW